MKMNKERGLGLGVLVTVLGGLAGCGETSVECGAGTQLRVAADGTQSCEPVTTCPTGTTLVTAEDGSKYCKDTSTMNPPDCATALPGSELKELGGALVCICPTGTGLLPGGAGNTCEPVGLPVCEYEGQTSCTPPPTPPPILCVEFPDDPNCIGGGPQLPPQAAEESCVGCHAPNNQGIEDPHPWLYVKCTDCHGGDPTKASQAEAHAAIPAVMANPKYPGRPNVQYYYNYLTTHGFENFGEEGLKFLRFINPSDLRIADQTCGKSTGCHAKYVAAFKGSVILTMPGLLDASLYRVGARRSYNSGSTERDARDFTSGITLGLDQIADALFAQRSDPNSAERIVYFTVAGLRSQNRDETGTYTEEDILRDITNKTCGDCHAGGKGRNDRYDDYRSGGCAACHMPYAMSGQSASNDPTVDRQEPIYPAAWANIAGFNVNNFNQYNDPVFIANFRPEKSHPIRHQLTKTVSDKQCKPCHSGSNRTVDQYEGRQWDPNRVYFTGLNNGAVNANQVKFATIIPQNDANARYNGQAFNQLIEYADLGSVMHGVNDQPNVPDGINDIAADVHKKADLWCLDCHQSKELHGDATLEDESQPFDPVTNKYYPVIFSRMDAQTKIRCENCHGTPDLQTEPNSAQTPNPVINVRRFSQEDVTNMGQALGITVPGVYLSLRSKPGQYRYIPQVKDISEPSSNAVKPTTRERLFRQNAFVAHARVSPQTSASNVGPGVGPCKNGNFNRGNCVANGSELVPNGFSHVGSQTTDSEGRPIKPGAQPANGLACYTCHATWQNACTGCHLTLADNDGNNVRYAGSPISGALSIGIIAQADFTWIPSQEWLMGINSRGKISPQMPMSKGFFRHVTRDNQQYAVTVLGANANATQVATGYKTYRDRLGFGNVTNTFAAAQGVQVGIKTVDVYGNTDPQGVPTYNHDPRSDENGALGMQAFAPHSIQNRAQVRNCHTCHFNLAGANDGNQVNYAMAQVGANPNGYQAANSGYVQAFQNVTAVRNNTNQPVSLAQGYLFDPNTDPQGNDGLAHRADYYVRLADGFPLSYSNHVILNPASIVDSKYRRIYDSTAAGPFTLDLLKNWDPNNAQTQVLVAPLNTQQ
ncbi:MAG: hypothetical protein HY791_14585 [Deltaproteobacteria bacterium]|nr:hypothetical protein [Deltaproteobacteria bacterium]